MEYLLAFLFGLAVGSFCNVLIYRLPRNISVVFPSSSCPHCSNPIRWYDNIPLISFMILRGRCRHCGGKISLQYPLVELACGLLAVYSLYRWGLSTEGAVMFSFFSALLVVSLIDLRFFIIPDIITIPGTLVGLASSFFRSDIEPLHSAAGAVAGFLIPLLIYLYYIKLRKMEGLGLGDVKLLTFIGSVTGIYGVLSALFLGSLFGLLYALPSVVKNRSVQFAIPFGPFLSLGCFAGVVFKEALQPF
jgi:leader peptidase (prepilin peptidase)/N-methyltransferase